MELRQAKGQSHDLRRTGDFFTTLMKLEPGEEVPKSPQKMDQEREAANSANDQKRDVLMSPDPLSPFTQPPMPPPSQPLPDKPDIARSIGVDSINQPIKRVDTEKPRSTLNSPSKTEPHNGQIVSLLEALKSVKKESDSQGDRIKHLELALKRERRAREMAEKRARALAGDHQFGTNAQEGTIEEPSFDPPLDSIELLEQELPNGHIKNTERNGERLSSSSSMETLRESNIPHRETEETGVSASQSQARLDLMLLEMDEMKNIMEIYKRRAEDAEESRRGLVEMVENIRAGRDPHDPQDLRSGDSTLVGSDSNSGQGLSLGSHSKTTGGNHGLWTSPSTRQTPNGSVSPGDMQREIERTLSNVLQQQRPGENGRMAQSAPYVSMVGVVLIGVGIMTWLNGWQPGGDSR